jgi:hypothetical protein
VYRKEERGREKERRERERERRERAETNGISRRLIGRFLWFTRFELGPCEGFERKKKTCGRLRQVLVTRRTSLSSYEEGRMRS